MLTNILNNHFEYQPGLSIDCVIFGFHDGELKVLLINQKFTPKWSLPGGFVPKNTDIDTAAIQVLLERTGLDGIFLRQFATFGAVNRNQIQYNKSVLDFYNKSITENLWFLERYVSIGYYALVDYIETVPQANDQFENIAWVDLKNLPELILDHQLMIEKALESLRYQLNQMPIGYNLLPEKFTLPEIQKLYESILDKKLDRRNFLRKMNNTGILIKLSEKKNNVPHKAPNLYRFDKEKYDHVLKSGLNQGW